MPRLEHSVENNRKTGQTVVSTTAIPLTKIGDTSGAGTTFTAAGVTDAAAWDLSAVAVNDVAVTSDGYKGVITAVDDGSDNLAVRWWVEPGGKRGSPNGDVKPADTSTVTIHRVDHCVGILVKALVGNTAVIRVGLDGNSRATDYPLSAGKTLYLFPYQTARNIDITKVFILAESGSQTVSWIVTAIR